MTEIEIPTTWDLLYPTLATIQQLDGSASKSQLEEKVPQVANLSDEQLSVVFPDDSNHANTSKVLYRLAWALTCLKKINAADNSERGAWSITPEGVNYLNLSPKEGAISLTKAVREAYAKERISKSQQIIDEEINILIVTVSYEHRFFTNINDFKQYISEEILLSNSGASLQEIVEGGENDTVEFKATLRVNLTTGKKDKKIEYAVIKTIAGFLNSDGGILLIGIADDGSPIGIQHDNFKSEDKMNQHLVNLVKSRIAAHAMTKIRINFEDYLGNRVMKVECDPSHVPVYVKEGSEERFYVRMGASTDHLPPSQIPDYIKTRFE